MAKPRGGLEQAFSYTISVSNSLKSSQRSRENGVQRLVNMSGVKAHELPMIRLA